MVVFGVRVKDKEDPGDVVLETIKDHLKLQLQRSDIEICHALGNENSRSPRPRPLIVKFRYRDTKWDVMKARKTLKKTGIVFTEDLCQEFYSMNWKDIETSNQRGLGTAKWWLRTNMGKSTQSNTVVTGKACLTIPKVVTSKLTRALRCYHKDRNKHLCKNSIILLDCLSTICHIIDLYTDLSFYVVQCLGLPYFFSLL